MMDHPLTVYITSLENPEGTFVSVAPQGDLDVLGGVSLRRSMTDAIDRYRPARVDVDLAHVTFLDCAGLRVLVWADDRIRGGGGTMAILHASGTALGLLTFLGLDRRLSVRLDRPTPFTPRRLPAINPSRLGPSGQGPAVN